MANQSDILSRLREYEVQPPSEVYLSLLDRLQPEMARADDSQWQGAFQGLQQLEVQPPSFMSLAISNAIADTPLFSFLQEAVVTPPAKAFDSIMKQVAATAGKPRNTTSIIKTISLHRYKAIAAVFILVFAGWALYHFTTSSTQKDPVKVAQKTTPQTGPVIDSLQQTVATVPDSVRYQLYDNPQVENYFKASRFSMEGSGFTLVENDFVATFASFQYEDLPSFLTAEDEESKEQLIRLDQYSYFTISKNMVDMLKRMYQRKSKGTPTRKARKEKEKLEQWKKADETRFDQKQLKNPLDPIDMAEFIFK
jgi:hypothetical protein